jgi:hypothetical protein
MLLGYRDVDVHLQTFRFTIACLSIVRSKRSDGAKILFINITQVEYYIFDVWFAISHSRSVLQFYMK